MIFTASATPSSPARLDETRAVLCQRAGKVVAGFPAGLYDTLAVYYQRALKVVTRSAVVVVVVATHSSHPVYHLVTAAGRKTLTFLIPPFLIALDL